MVNALNVDKMRRRRSDGPTRFGAYDYAVVGTGPGGATVARELSRAGHSVAMLERGLDRPVTGSARQTLRELMLPGRSLHMAGNLTLLRAATVGGSSVYFHGTAWEPPYERLERHGLDLRSDVEDVKRELRPAPVPVDRVGPRARMIAASARRLGLDWAPLPKFFDADGLDEPPIGSYVAPAAAKWSARQFVDEAASAGAILVTGARVERVLVDGGHARGVEFVSAGRREQIEARRVVLAAGGIGSPLILRASGIERAGRDYFYDPFVSVMGSVEGLDAGQELSMLNGVEMHEEGYLLSDLNTPPWWFALDAVLAGRPDRALAHRHTLVILAKARDDLSGALTRRGGLGKPLTDGDREKLVRGERRAREILEGAGARHVFRSGAAAVHPGGTAKVGDVVDSDLRTEIGGLYVCDASVIPIPWGLPPTLTVLGLAKRLARHLDEASRPRAHVTPAPAASR